MYPYWSYFTAMWPQTFSSLSDTDPDGTTDDGNVDERLADQVADRVIADRTISAGQMEITVQNRVVILNGRVDSAVAKHAAARQAWLTPGVYDVCNSLVADA